MSFFKILYGRENIEESSAFEIKRGNAKDERYITESSPIVVREDSETEEDEDASAIQ